MHVASPAAAPRSPLREAAGSLQAEQIERVVVARNRYHFLLSEAVVLEAPPRPAAPLAHGQLQQGRACTSGMQQPLWPQPLAAPRCVAIKVVSGARRMCCRRPIALLSMFSRASYMCNRTHSSHRIMPPCTTATAAPVRCCTALAACGPQVWDWRVGVCRGRPCRWALRRADWCGHRLSGECHCEGCATVPRDDASGILDHAIW